MESLLPHGMGQAGAGGDMRRSLILTAVVLAAGAQAAWFPAGRVAAAPDVPVPAASAGPAAVTGGARSALRYDFGFAGTTGKVGNSAPDGPALRLSLYGAWWRVPGGVHFSGSTGGRRSVAYGKPAGGHTLDVPATGAIGLGAKIRYEKPARGTCFTDTPNLTQIGRDALHSAGAQAKIQLSSCVASRKHVFVECRFSGAASAPGVPPLVGTLALASGATYDISCVKSPDSQGHTVVTLRVTRLATGTSRVNKFTIAAVGTIRSDQYLSAANKYPLPSPASNTDQFVGDMTRTVYCAGPLPAVQRCLSVYLPR